MISTQSIEALQKKFPDVPKTIILKADLLRIGVKFSETALKAIGKEKIQCKGYFIFSQDIGGEEAFVEGKIPHYLYFESDDAAVQVRYNTKSPYLVDLVEGKFILRDGTGEEVEKVYFEKAPKWLFETIGDTPMQAIVQPIGKDKVVCCFDYYCDFWTKGEQCLFCNIVTHLKGKKQQEKGVITRHDPKLVAKCMEKAFLDPPFRHMALSAGTILRPRDGKNELEFLIEYLYAIGEKLGVNKLWSSYFQIVPHSKDEIKKLYDTGVTSLHMNLEVWDERLFNIICPGKARVIGRDEFIRQMIDAVEIFGKGRILSDFVTGVEMAQPFGFKDVKSAVKSTLSGFEFLMSHDVLPRMDVWAVEKGSALEDQSPSPLEYYIEVERGYLELRQKYNFPFPFPGYCHGCTVSSSASDWDYHFWER